MHHERKQLRGNILILGALILSAFFTALPSTFAAEFHASTTIGTYTNTKELVISAYTDQHNPFNAAAAIIHYDPNEIYPLYETTTHSIFPYFTIEPVIDHDTHTIVFAGGTPALGGFIFTGRLFSIEYIPLQEKSPSVVFTQKEILAADGLGTNIVTETIY